MKKKINKDYTNHWLYPVLGTYCNNFYGVSPNRLFRVIEKLKLFGDNNIVISDFIPIPVSPDTFVLVIFVQDTKHVDYLSTYPIKSSTLKKYGYFLRDDLGVYFFKLK